MGKVNKWNHTKSTKIKRNSLKEKKTRKTVGRKIFITFLTMFMLIAGLSAFILYGMNKINQKSTEIQQTWLPTVEGLGEMRFYIEQVVSFQLFYANAKTVSEMDDFEQRFEEIFLNLDELFEDYEEVITTEKEKEIYQNFRTEWDAYLQVHEQVLELSRNAESNQVKTTIRDSRRQIEVVENYLSQLVELNQQHVAEVKRESDQILVETFILSVVIIVLVLIISIILGITLGRNISKPLALITSKVKQVASGNLLTEPLTIKNKDEIGQLANDFNQMSDNLMNLIHHVNDNAQLVTATSEELSASADQTKKATEQISTSIQEVAYGIENQVSHASAANEIGKRISSGMEHVSSSIHSVADLAKLTNEHATSGQDIVSQTIEQMKDVHKKVNLTSTAVHTLGEKSKEIGQIVGLITEIAEQTNLLALNAAIEAARAGEHGVGFAVVAKEVKKLSQQSGQAAENIKMLVNEIAGEAIRTEGLMVEGSSSVDEGLSMVNMTGKTFIEIAQMIAEVTAQSQAASNVAEQVHTNSQQLVKMVKEISAISIQSATNSEEVAASAEEQNASMEEISMAAESLSGQALELQKQVQKFIF
ncbi:methyl-accepting chemotaxis protein [Metabacillus malikii]|uniref:Methyl-accepting chemotaxis protein n=1 Tax=Metabacillus malikii TaxID=1504265 RepID=A0ABT9ZET9_9BACI|nr:methyl-accepting chemotaxis protein [Metabacillus malikii]MDQ0230784.1 methyl-accepting chemotaxis protein [Metabacillus malikii]